MSVSQHSRRKMILGIVGVHALALALAVVTFALVYFQVSVEDNTFITGTVDINLNDGEPVIDEDLFEPGVTVVREFFLQNEGSGDVYYRIYLDNVRGELMDVLDVTITYDDTVLASGKASELTRDNVEISDDVLKVGQKKIFTITFCYPEDEGNDTQGGTLSFDMKADAVQTKNNPDKDFD